jgi:hypothetical protein
MEISLRLRSVLQHDTQLTHLRLQTEMIFHGGHLDMKTLLALPQLKSLEVSMKIDRHTFPSAIELVKDLLDRDPSLETILFGNWIGGMKTWSLIEGLSAYGSGCSG